jgi:hypothetical protein
VGEDSWLEIPGCSGSRVESFTHDPDQRWVLGATDGVSLATYGPWQVVDGARVLLASGDDGHSYGLATPIDAPAKAFELLRGRAIVRVEVDPRYGDLRIDLATLALRVRGDSSGYEPWFLRAREGVEWVAQGNGRVIRL